MNTIRMMCLLVLILSVLSIYTIANALEIKPYGYIKLDAIFDDSVTDNVDYSSYVEPGDTDNAKFSMHARQTRFGAWFLGPNVGHAKSLARFEFDLTNGGADNKYLPGIRHAYLELTGDRFSLVAGQTSDIISPLNPDTVNYTVTWAAGNIGYRNPQIALTYNLPIKKSMLSSTLALVRNMGQDFSKVMAGASTDGGVDYPMPQIQARMDLKTKLGDSPAQFGFSGHYGREDYGASLGKFASYSGNVHLLISLESWFEMKGEFFFGSNLDQMLGGIKQGVNSTLARRIDSLGGWGQLKLKPSRFWEMNAGLGIDDPKDSDLSLTMRSRNLCAFSNLVYVASDVFRVALEYSHWRTSYIDEPLSDNNRIHLAFIYNL